MRHIAMVENGLRARAAEASVLRGTCEARGNLARQAARALANTEWAFGELALRAGFQAVSGRSRKERGTVAAR